MADWFLVGDDFTYLSDVVATWLAYGIGLGGICWAVGTVVSLIFKFVKY